MIYDTQKTNLNFGSSPYKSIDDAASWPNLRERDPGADEVSALEAKLVQLTKATEELERNMVARPIDELFGLSEIAEAEPHGTLRFFLPATLLDDVGGALAAADVALSHGLHEDGVAQLRYAEVLLRLANGWGWGEYQSTGELYLGLAADETTSVWIDTEVETVIQNGRPVEVVRRVIS